MSSASREIAPSPSLPAAQESFRNGTSSDNLQEFKDNDERRKNRALKDPRDAAAVAAGLCTEHGCKAAPMMNYRRCEFHHTQKIQRDSLRPGVVLRREQAALRRAARQDAIATGRCRKTGCLTPAVKFKKCVIHMTQYQRDLIGPRVLKPSGRRQEGDNMTWSKTPEYIAVNSHLQCIRLSYLPKNAAYQNMPFFAAWDPRQGGRLSVGAQWIVDNLGPKPSKDHELHIIDRHLGFVPENLAWVPREDHKREELLTKLLIENQQLKTRVTELEGKS